MPKDKGGPSRKISLQIPDDILRRDLETIKQEAFELGASMAEIIPAEWAEIDETVRLKCSVPLCPYYNKNLYCPPQGPSLDLMRKAIGRYSCLRILCGQERCLILEGGKCPFPLQSRPSMESVGIDVYRLATRAGWEIYPIYRSVDP